MGAGDQVLRSRSVFRRLWVFFSPAPAPAPAPAPIKIGFELFKICFKLHTFFLILTRKNSFMF